MMMMMMMMMKAKHHLIGRVSVEHHGEETKIFFAPFLCLKVQDFNKEWFKDRSNALYY